MHADGYKIFNLALKHYVVWFISNILFFSFCFWFKIFMLISKDSFIVLIRFLSGLRCIHGIVFALQVSKFLAFSIHDSVILCDNEDRLIQQRRWSNWFFGNSIFYAYLKFVILDTLFVHLFLNTDFEVDDDHGAALLLVWTVYHLDFKAKLIDFHGWYSRFEATNAEK